MVVVNDTLLCMRETCKTCFRDDIDRHYSFRPPPHIQIPIRPIHAQVPTEYRQNTVCQKKMYRQFRDQLRADFKRKMHLYSTITPYIHAYQISITKLDVLCVIVVYQSWKRTKKHTDEELLGYMADHEGTWEWDGQGIVCVGR